MCRSPLGSPPLCGLSSFLGPRENALTSNPRSRNDLEHDRDSWARDEVNAARCGNRSLKLNRLAVFRNRMVTSRPSILTAGRGIWGEAASDDEEQQGWNRYYRLEETLNEPVFGSCSKDSGTVLC